MRRSFDVADRRARLWARHHLATPSSGPDAVVTVARDLVGLHSSDPVSVFLQARARVADLDPAGLEDTLYERRRLVRVLGMRRTMFVVPSEDLPMLRASVTDRLADRERARTVKMLVSGGITDDGDAWLRDAAEATLAALRAHGPMTAHDLREVVPALAEQVVVGRGKRWEGTIGMSTRVLFWLATVGRIVRTDAPGSIKSTRYRWAVTEDWLGDAAGGDMDPESAAAELARRYLRSFGPASFDDLRWWTGWTKTLTRAALSALEVVEVALDGQVGLVLAGDEQPDADEADGRPAVALLPALDATAMGYRERGWYLGEHTGFPSALFDRAGNIGPTVWADGRVVGGWAQRDDGEIAWRLLEDVGRDLEAIVAEHAAGLEEWLGELRFVPRFRTPLERELSG